MVLVEMVVVEVVKAMVLMDTEVVVLVIQATTVVVEAEAEVMEV